MFGKNSKRKNILIYSLTNCPVNNAKYIPLFWKIGEQGTPIISSLKLNIQETKILASGPITSWQIDEETVERVKDFILEAPKSLQMVTAAMKFKDACSLEENL